MANACKELDDIELLRDRLSNLIQDRGKLSDSEVIRVSKLLDNALNIYGNKKFVGSDCKKSCK